MPHPGSKPNREIWRLWPGDLPPRRFRAAALRLDSLEENPVFRLAVSRRRTIAAIHFGPIYLALSAVVAIAAGWIFGQKIDFMAAAPAVRSAWFAASMLAAVALMFVIMTGVLHSETLYRMRFPAPDSLIDGLHLAGLKGETAGSALWGVSLSSRYFWPRVAAEALMVASLAALPFLVPKLAPFYGLLCILWFWMAATAAMALFLPDAALPAVVAAARRWRVAAQAAGQPPRALGLRLRNGFDRLLLVALNAVILAAGILPPIFILVADSWIVQGMPLPWRLRVAIDAAIIEGLLFGIARGIYVRRRQAEYLAMLDEEMDALIELRLTKLLGEPPGKPPPPIAAEASAP